MMGYAFEIACALRLDAAPGDPRRWPHPVSAIAGIATRLEAAARRRPGATRLAGLITALLVYGITGGTVALLVWGGGRIHPWAGTAVSIYFIYAALAARSLVDHARAVWRPLAADDLPAARAAVAMIVGRDTAGLDGEGVARAAVESVAESAVDGVTAPLFWAFLFGPVGAMAYRAVNTLDSLFGHKDERYFLFGWASARVDDVANWIPARLTAALLCLAAAPMGRAGAAWRVLRRDGRKHASPNAGLPEAAAAGALGVRLGGLRHYDGEPHPAPAMGEPEQPPGAGSIARACLLMYVAVVLFALAGLGATYGVEQVWRRVRASGTTPAEASGGVKADP
jgi:adenosylcobinamide-phosphate synthase